MKLIVTGSSSKGNGYILDAGDQALLIEAGVRYKHVKRALNFDVGKIVGCIVSHEHNDHAGYMSEYITEGVKVHAPTSNKVHPVTPLLSFVSAGAAFRLGSFHVLPFSLLHDVPTCGYLIDHPQGKTLFITDTHYTPYQFKGVNNFIIEANYSRKILTQRLADNEIDYSYYERVMRSHMSLETAIEMLKANDLSKAKNIVLIHLSDGNSDEVVFAQEVMRETGMPVHIADTGKVFDLNIF
jgi:phosphoribosyl 1,2-cyclic phosphodiesterase